MDLKNFASNSGDKKKQADQRPKNEPSQKERDIIENARKYEGMGEDALFTELLKNVQNAKSSGNFNYNEILNFANTMFPYLQEEQRTKLIELLKIIGNG